jgi:hypothetical protein
MHLIQTYENNRRRLMQETSCTAEKLSMLAEETASISPIPGE